MQESGDELWRHVLGGYNDLRGLLGESSEVEVRPFLPVLCGEENKVVFSLWLDTSNEVLTFHREHLGRFIPGAGKFSAKRLKKWLRVCDEMLEKKGVLKGDGYDEREDANDVADSESGAVGAEEKDEFESGGEWLKETRERLERLAALISQTEAIHSKQNQCEMTYSRAAARLKVFPHHCFEALADELSAWYASRYPLHFRPVMILTKLLSMPQALPAEYVRAVFLPLYVPIFGERRVMKDFGNGESSEVLQYLLRYKPFCGFGYKVLDKTAGLQGWSAEDQDTPEEYEDLIPLLSLDVSTEKPSQRLMRMFYMTLNGMREASKNDARWSEGLRRWLEYDECVHHVPGTFHHRQVRRLLGTELGIASLQSQISLSTHPYSSESLACLSDRSEHRGTDELLTILCRFTRSRVQRTLKTLRENNLNYFQMKDVLCTTVELPSGPTMIKMGFVPDSNREQPSVRKAFEELRLTYSTNVRKESVQHVLHMGLWSPYNSTECTQWGNLNARDPNKTGGVVSTQGREPLLDLTDKDVKKWQYEFKQIQGCEPGNPLAWVYCARGNLMTSLGALHGFTLERLGSTSTETKTGDTVLSMAPDLLYHSLRGFVVRMKAAVGDYGLTFQQVSSTNTVKAYALSQATKKPLDATNLQALNRLTWTHVSESDPEKMRYLASRYDLKKMVGRLIRAGMNLYYKRPFYVSPIGALINASNIMRMRNHFVYAPVAMLTCHNVVITPVIKCCSMSMSSVIPWKDVNIYKVILDTNSFYSTEKRQEWAMGSGNAYTGIDSNGNGQSGAADIVRSLLDEYEGSKIGSSVLNLYSFSKEKYLTIVHMLKSQDMYVEDEECVYASEKSETLVDDEEDDDDMEDPLDMESQASYALHALEQPNFSQKRKVYTSVSTVDDSEDNDNSTALDKLLLKTNKKRQKLLEDA